MLKNLLITFLFLSLFSIMNPVFANELNDSFFYARTAIDCRDYGTATKILQDELVEKDLLLKDIVSIELMLGRALASQGKVAKGLAMMEKHFNKNSADAVTTYDYAYVLYKAKKLKEAQKILESKLINDSPWRYNGLLLLGKVLVRLNKREAGAKKLVMAMMLGNKAVARSARKTLYHTTYTTKELASYGLNLKIKEMSQEQIAASRKATNQNRGKRPMSGKPYYNASIGIQHDSNLTGLPTAHEESPPVGVDEADDFSLSMKIGGRIPAAGEGNTFIFSIDSQLPYEQKSYDSTAIYMEMENNEKMGRGNLTKSFFFGTSTLDNHQGMHYFGFLLDYSVQVTDSHRWKANFNIKEENHSKPFWPEEDRNGLNHTFGYTHYYKVGKLKVGARDNRSELGIGLNYKNANTDGNVYSMSGFGPRVEWSKPLCQGKFISLRYLYWTNGFDGPPVTAPTAQNRHDYRNQVDIDFTAPLKNGSTFWSRFGYTRNRSTDWFQDRKATTISSGVSWKF